MDIVMAVSIGVFFGSSIFSVVVSLVGSKYDKKVTDAIVLLNLNAFIISACVFTATYFLD